jgi:predicted HAD superfamily Cof-like phosphohydrolase
MPAKIQCPVVMFSIAPNLLSLKHKIEQMKKQLNHVEKFHDTFGIPNEYTPKATISNDLIDLRFKLMAEENEEYLEAAKNGDLVEVADALGDMMYILCGTILSHGMQHKIEEVFEEIQRSNMSKLGEDGKPIYREDGKVLKGPNYFKPNIAKIIER